MKKPLPIVKLKEWNEADHPREPAGSEEGGQFTESTGGGGAGASAEAKLKELGILLVTKDKGVNPERAETVLNRAYDVLSSLMKDDVVKAAVENGPMNNGALRIHVAKGTRVVREDHEGKAKSALAWYNKSEHLITIASGLRVTGGAEKPAIGKSAWMVGDDFATVLAHELGHAASGKIAIRALNNGLGEEEVGAALYRSKPRSYWESGVSQYAGTNVRELVAEAFAAYTHPGYGKAKPLPKELVRLFEAAKLQAGKRKSACQCVPVVRLMRSSEEE